MPTSLETSLKCKTEAVCALATRRKIRTSGRIFRITMSVPIIEQRKLINHEGHEDEGPPKSFQPQRAQRSTEGTKAEYCLCAASGSSVSSVVRTPVHVEYRFSCFDRDPGRESHENVCALFVCRPIVPGPAWFHSSSLCWRCDFYGVWEASHRSTGGR